MSFLNGLKRTYGFVKNNGPSFFRGIKKGIMVGKEIIDVSKNIIDKINQINPEIGSRLQKISNNKNFKRLDNTLNNANNIINLIENPKRYFNPLSKEQQKITDNLKKFQDEENMAIDIVKNMG